MKKVPVKRSIELNRVGRIPPFRVNEILINLSLFEF